MWCCDVDIAEDANLTEDDMHLARTQGIDSGPLECSGISEGEARIKAARSGR